MKKQVEPVTGIEPAFSAWKADALSVKLHRRKVPSSISEADTTRSSRLSGPSVNSKKEDIMPGLPVPGGATSRNRTDDLRVTKPPLYLLSYDGISPGSRRARFRYGQMSFAMSGREKMPVLHHLLSGQLVDHSADVLVSAGSRHLFEIEEGLSRDDDRCPAQVLFPSVFHSYTSALCLT